MPVLKIIDGKKKFKTSELELKESFNTRLVSIRDLKETTTATVTRTWKNKRSKGLFTWGWGTPGILGNSSSRGIRDLKQSGRHPLKYFVFGGHDGTRPSLTLPVPSPS